ncbi:MAG TPA: antibiotic biosynthesis monooxygenase [Pyrinomonadaceae bacterium]|nr:antibiotic biosynthesis monooxygenase [Pyrinomonadaceae bacterium]
MFVAVYRWKLREGLEENFRAGWLRLTLEIYRERGSLGSRLHRAEDGTWVAYAQWPDRQTWQAGRSVPTIDAEAVVLMKESIETSYPEMLLEVAEDLLTSRSFSETEE